jgi:hypothetical protein
MPLMKEVILLVGLNKTGTQSLQATCVANRRAIHRAGIFYPFLAPKDGNHNPLIEAMFGVPFFGSPAAREEKRAGMRKWFDEGLSGVQKKRLLLVAIEAAWLSREQLADLKKWFADRGWAVKVIVNVRHLSTWVHSMVAQRVVGRRRMTIAAALEEFVNGGLIRPRLENLQSVFPDTEVRSYEEALEHPQGPQAAFLGSLGVDTSSVHFERVNERASDCAVRALSAFNEQIGPQDATEGIAERLAVSKALRGLPGQKFILQAGEVPEPVIRRVAEERAWIAATLGPKFQGPTLQLADGRQEWPEEARRRLVKIAKACTPRAQEAMAARIPLLRSISSSALH